MLLFPVRLKASCAAPLVSVMPRLVFAPRVSGLDAGVGALRVRVLAVIVRLPVASWSVSMVGPGREESSRQHLRPEAVPLLAGALPHAGLPHRANREVAHRRRRRVRPRLG